MSALSTTTPVKPIVETNPVAYGGEAPFGRLDSDYPDSGLQPKQAPKARPYLYGASIALLTIALVFFIVSLFVDRVEVYVSRSADTTMKIGWLFIGFCKEGCRATSLPVSDNGPDGWLSPSSQFERMAESAVPFKVATCTEVDDPNVLYNYTVTIISETVPSLFFGTPQSVDVRCGRLYDVSAFFTGRYRASMTSYGLVGGKRISGSEYYASGLSSVGLYLSFAFACVALLLLIVVSCVLGKSRRAPLGDRTCCCACCGSSCRTPLPHSRRLVSAIVAFIVLSVAMSAVQLATCDRQLAWYPPPYSDWAEASVPGAHYGIVAAMLVAEVAALVLMCIVHAKRMW